jgi:hypothetical protein
VSARATPVMMRKNFPAAGTDFIIIFVDAIFTTLFERPFTNVFDVIAQIAAFSCVYPARITG